jgi:hypothetical protein
VTVICESNLAMHRHGYALMQEATGPSEKAGRMLACCKKITNPRLGNVTRPESERTGYGLLQIVRAELENGHGCLRAARRS